MLGKLTNALSKLFGTKYDRDIKTYLPVVSKIHEEGAQLAGLSQNELRLVSLELKERIKDYLADIDAEITKINEQANIEEDIHQKEALYEQVDALKKDRDLQLEVVLKDILPRAFALVKETAKRFTENTEIEVQATDHDRNLAAKKPYIKISGDKAIYANSWKAAGGDITWNMVHYDVQLIGGMVLHDGKIAEMMTGEGKTLVATLPAYLNGLSGQGVHVVTVNDYLARRDSEWVGPIFEFLFLTIDCIDKYKPHTPERRNAYLCDITYGTNNEFGFDYLRDNMVRSPEERVQRKHHYGMVDEVDSVLIDDARTPLIISGPVQHHTDEEEYVELKPKVEKVIETQKKLVTELLSQARQLFHDGVLGNEEGQAGMALLRAHRAFPKYRPLIKFLSEEGVKVMLQKTENYYMQENNKNMHLVDAGLYFTIDEKNRNVELTDKGAEFMAKGNDDPNFFIMPDLATSLMEIESNTSLTPEEIVEQKESLIRDYSVKSQRLHCTNQLLKAYALFEKDEEYVVIDGQVKIVDESTGRLMEGRRYSDGLHQAIEAKENVKVGDITQTYATITLQNYFRMFHKLAGMTGTAETEAGEFWTIYKLDVVVIPTNRAVIRKDNEDLVFKTAKEKFNAVIDEIENLTKQQRPVLVGTTSVDISEKLSRMLQMRGIKHNVLNAKQHQREAEVVAEAGHPGAVTIATNMAGRGTDIKIGEIVKNAGGLAIIGTERHDSRRVDRQLRGRSGRQGDPGSSTFYVSLEDNLMRLFHSERIAGLMDKMGHKEGEVIQHSMVTKSIERAQKKVEENNFGIRKRLLEYDDVMNIQRGAIYKKRQHALDGDRLAVDINSILISLSDQIAQNAKSTGSYQIFVEESIKLLGIDPDITEDTFNRANRKELVEMYQDEVFDYYKRKFDKITEVLLPIIQNVYHNEGHRYKRIAIPYTDGSAHPLPISADLETTVKSNGKTIRTEIEKAITLAIIDEEWMEHLRNMDELKDSVQSASFEQKDPLVIYKMEAFNLFQSLIGKINERISSYLLKGTVVFQDGTRIEEARQKKTDLSKVSTNKTEEAMRQAATAASSAGHSAPKVETFVRTEKKIGRNDPCPCGSGKKYKQCHGRDA